MECNLGSDSAYLSKPYGEIIKWYPLAAFFLLLQFSVKDVQDNVKIAQKRLSNFKEDGEVFETWNCTYVLCKIVGGWRIFLATFDDKGVDAREHL